MLVVQMRKKYLPQQSARFPRLNLGVNTQSDGSVYHTEETPQEHTNGNGKRQSGQLHGGTSEHLGPG